MVDSLHPGNGGNPAFKQYDLDQYMRIVFWPANIGWISLGVWIATLKVRMGLVAYKRENQM
jgi:heme exporter protein C